jgi:hypothetical protein
MFANVELIVKEVQEFQDQRDGKIAPIQEAAPSPTRRLLYNNIRTSIFSGKAIDEKKAQEFPRIPEEEIEAGGPCSFEEELQMRELKIGN